MSVPTSSEEVTRVAVVRALTPEPVVVSVPVPSVEPLLAKVTLPVADVAAPATEANWNTIVTGEPAVEFAGPTLKVSAVPGTAATVTVAVAEPGPKEPSAENAAETWSIPTGSDVVVTVPTQEVGADVGVAAKFAVPSSVPPLAKTTLEVGQAPPVAGLVSVKTTGDPYVSPAAGETVSVPDIGAGAVTVKRAEAGGGPPATDAVMVAVPGKIPVMVLLETEAIPLLDEV